VDSRQRIPRDSGSFDDRNYGSFACFLFNHPVWLDFSLKIVKQTFPMLPDQPNPPESTPLQARHRPTLGNLAQDTTELDLWAFDDDIESDAEQVKKTSLEPREETSSGYPVRLAGEIPVLPAPQMVPAFERIRRNITKPKPSGNTPPPSRAAVAQEEDFEDLERWDDVPASPAETSNDTPAPKSIPAPSSDAPKPPTTESSIQRASEPTPPAAATVSSDESPAPNPAETAAPAPSDTTSPAAAAASLPRLHLGKFEGVLLAVFGVLLLGVFGWLLAISVFSLPKETQRLGSADFPVKGAVVQVQSASSFWRSPNLSTEVVRRGTQLIPVVRLQFGSGSGQIRVVFADADGKTVGDAFIRSIKDNETHEFAATAGFDDIGMYASYRTGGTKPWTVRVFEAPAGNTKNPEFRKLLELDIAPERSESTP